MTSDQASTIKFFLVSQLFSVFGSAIVDYVLVWYITIKSGSGIVLSISMLVTFLPKILAASFIENHIKNLNLKKVLIVADSFVALLSCVLAVIVYSGNDSYFLLLFVMALRASGAGIQGPCSKVFIAEITPRTLLLKVNGYNTIITSICSLLAPALGGVIVAYISISSAMLLNPITALFAIMVLFKIKSGRGKSSEDSVADIKVVSEKIDKNIFVVLSWHVLFTFFIVPITYLTPLLVSGLFTNDVLKLAYNEMFYSLGAISAGIIIGIIAKENKTNGYLILSSVLAGVCIIVMSLTIEYFMIYLLAMMASSFFINIFQIQMITCLQKLPTDINRGKVFAKMEVLTNIALPIGMLIWGWLSDTISIKYSLICSGVGLFIVGAKLIIDKGKLNVMRRV